jgi:amino acid adenylation domain-containing protein
VHPSPGAASVAIDFLEDGSSTKISYESLHVLSDAVARRIIRTLAGLGHASGIIPIFLPQCPELYIAILAILKAGKAFCPLGLDTPPERLKFILKDLSANLVITKSVHNSDVLRGLNVQPLLVDRNAPVSERCLSPCIPCVETGDMAYVLYTSGSTGLPKAVSVSHRAATQSLLAHDRHIPRFDRFLQFAAPTFDVSIFEIFFPLFRGKTIVGCSRPHMLNDLPSVIRDLQVDAAELTPTVVSNLIQTRDNVPELKLLLTIGEMLTRHVVDEFGGSSSVESILWGMYGPTEVAIHCTLQPSFQATSSVGNIGSPLDSVSAFIMRPVSEDNPPTTLEILPIGNVGELVLGGYQVADGYLNRPDLTAAAFVQHQEYGLLYRTGDKARLLPDGSLECLGRIESGQVKLRGQRVELGEIEQAISRIDGCRTVAALPIRDTLVAFCAVRSGVLTKEAIMEGCERWLPSHMVPGDVVLLPHMPHLPSGKTDKKALESQYLHQQQSEAVAMPHLNSPIHQVLRQVLGRDVPSNPKLDALAMDSLRSIQVASKLRQQGYNLGAIDVLSASDLQELLSLCETRRFHGVPEDPVEFQDLRDDILRVAELTPCKDAIEAVTPCTPLQTAMLAETMIRPDAYCNWIEVEIPVPRTFEEIRAHIQRLAMDNEILRSGFSATSSGTASFAQIIWKQVDRLQIINVASFSKKFSLGSSESLLQPFRVQVNAPLARPRIVFQIHHALYDGWSFDILLRDLGVLLSGDPVEPRPQYSEVVKFYLRTSYGDDRRVSLSFWSTILNNYHPVRLPNFNGKIVHAGPLRSFSQQSSIRTCALLERAEEFSIHPQVFFQAAVLRMMSFFLGTTDVVIGTVTSGRTIPLTGIEQIVGPCIASLPLRLDLSNCATTTDMLRHIQKSNRDMLQHCTVPLRDIVKSCGLQPGTALFEILFVWQESVFSNNAESALKIIDQADELEYKLTLEFQPLDGHVLVKATYDPSTFPEAQIERLLDQIDEVVVYLTRNINGTVDDNMHCFSLQNLSVANPLPIMKTFHRGPAYTVERWALEAPEKESLIFGAKENGLMIARESITYFDLNARANRLAHFLRAQGVGGDELVCVLMEKSVDLYVSILAVLKLGCGYLPIVPDSPPERTRKILADAQVRICISESSAAAHMRSQVACVVLDVDLIDLSTFSDKNLDTRYNGSHLAYAVFTSGSTGTPKGVLVTQDNLMSNLDYLYGVYPTAERSRLLQACSQAFDVSVFEIFFAWYAGMCLCTATKNDLFSDLEDAINKLEITHLSLTPTVAALINPDHVPTVQFLVTAGEAVTEHVRRQWAGRGLYQGILSLSLLLIKS